MAPPTGTYAEPSLPLQRSGTFTLAEHTRRDRLRLRRRRPEVRPDLRRRLRQDGQRRLDGRDHPGRDPAAAAHARGRERQPHSLRHADRSPTGATPPTSSSPSTSRCCSSRHRLGALADDAIILVENLWATHAERRHPRRVGQGDGGALAHGATASSRCRWKSSASPSTTIRARARTCSPSGCWRAIYGRDLDADRGADRLRLPQEVAKRCTSGTSRCCGSATPGPSEHIDFRIEVPPRRSTEPLVVMNGNEALGLGRARVGHGAVRDVPDHAGDLGLALPARGLREVRRHPAPGRGRDRRGRRRDRRVVRRQGRVHRHVGARASRSRPSSSASRS